MSMKVTEILGPDGHSKIYIQYDEDDIDRLQAVGVRFRFPEDIKERTKIFKEMITSTVSGYSEMLLDTVRQGMKDFRPDKVTLEFGLQIGGEAGVPIITKGTAQANVKVSVEWNLEKRERHKNESV